MSDIDFDDLNAVIKLQRDNEGYVRDMRRASKEAIDFCTKRDGQWEPSIIRTFKNRPRYTDDRVNPIINQIVGEIYQAEFTGRVRPAGGDATKETAKALDGLIRTIRNKSHFERIINQTGRRVAVAGIGGWEVVKDYADAMSFHMDLLINPIEDYHERVLLDPNAMNPVGEGAKWGIIKHFIGKQAFKEEFGADKKVVSLGHDNWSDSYYYKPENILIGQLYYLKPVTMRIALMSDGSVYEMNDNYALVQDDLAQQGITQVDTRETNTYECHQRWYSADEWLTENETIDFDFVPIVPCYGNFEVTEGKIIHFGAVERLMDPQRVHNYAFSRNVEEVALSPRSKWFMTPEQAAGYEAKLRTLNTNMDPVQFYNHVPDQPPPFYSNTSGQNEAVGNLIMMTDDGINKAAGIFAANIGDNPNIQSGIAIQEQIDRGNNGTSWVFEALEMSIEQTCKYLLRAIPKTYDGTREVVLTSDDGSLESMVINDPVVDDETGNTVYLYDVTVGQYDVTIDVGAGYKNRQAEAAASFERLAAADPVLMEIGRDIHLNNIEAPNMDLLAERARAMMLNQGVIPEEQLTEEEAAFFAQQEAQAAANPPPPDPETIALEIEQMNAQTAMMVQTNKQTENQMKLMQMQQDAAENQRKLESDLAVEAAKIQQGDRSLDLQEQKQTADEALSAMQTQMQQQKQQFDAMMDMQKQQTDQMVAMADIMNKLKQSMGADAIIDQNAVEAYSKTAEELSDSIDEVD